MINPFSFKSVEQAVEFAKDMRVGTGFIIKIGDDLIMVTKLEEGVRWHIVGPSDLEGSHDALGDSSGSNVGED